MREPASPILMLARSASDLVLHLLGLRGASLQRPAERRQHLLTAVAFGLPLSLGFTLFNLYTGFIVLAAVEALASLLLLSALWLLRRVGQVIPTLLILSILIFGLQQLMPGDPALILAGEERGDPAVLAAIRAELGLDKPIWHQYLLWMGKVLTGDFGFSWRIRVPVSELILTKLPVTFQLATMAFIIAILIGVPLGILSAVRKDTPADWAANGAALFGISTPNFWLGIMMILLFSVELGWLPPSGYVPLTEDPIQSLATTIMPAFVLGTGVASVLMRHTRAAMLSALSQDYVRTARAKGLRERVGRVLSHWAACAALPSAFLSPLVGPLGTMIERKACIYVRVARTPCLAAKDGPPAPVALIKMSMGDDGRLLKSLPDLGYAGAVIEGMGAGHVLAEVAPILGELAAKMQLAAPEALDFSKESDAMKTMYGIQEHRKVWPTEINAEEEADYMGRKCLTARRLLERGVRFVQIWSGNDNGFPRRNWDSHEDVERDHGPLAWGMAKAVSALILDLKQRGLLDETIILWTTEFGRMPSTQGGKGRDHNPYVFTNWLCGGGIKGGVTAGESDQWGYKPLDRANPTTCYDIHATMMHLLGIDHERLTVRHNGIDRRLTDVHGHVIQNLVA
jgi:ABC-type dipeptide/oligopeptide/nickel transport system permease component